MSKSFKERVKENKSKIITGVMFGATVLGAGYLLYTKDQLMNECCDLKEQINQNTKDIELLREVMSEDVMGTLREALLRKLRYHEGRLNNGMKKGSNMTEADKQMHKETIDFVNNKLIQLLKAEERLSDK